VSLDDIEAPEPFDPFPMPIIAQCSVDFIEEQFAFDNCSGFIFGTTDVVFPITETTTVVWTFTDAAGNTTTTNQEVIVEDTMAPVASGFIITITAQGFLTDEVVWSFTDGSGNLVASGGPYWDGGQGVVLEVAFVDGTNGPYSFMGTTAGFWNDNVFSFTIQCQGATVASGTVNAGQTVNANNIASCNTFTDIVAFCPINSLAPVSATDNCAGAVAGSHNAVFPISSSTTITWLFDDGNGNVTTQDQNIVIQNMNTTVSTVGSALVANETSPGVSYSWVDCDNNNTPVGVTNQSFIPNENGNYAVILQIGSCTEMSDCIAVTDVSITDETPALFRVYPNPATELLHIHTSNSGTLDLIDFSGKVVMQTAMQPGANTLNLNQLASGTYILRMIGATSVQTSRIVVNRN
jgi:hypothetical protein